MYAMHPCVHAHTHIHYACTCMPTNTSCKYKNKHNNVFFKEIQLGELGLMTDAFAGT